MRFFVLLSMLLGAGWRELSPGLDIGEFPLAVKSDMGDSTATILRADPAKLDLKLLQANELKANPLTAKEWGTKTGAVAVFNAGMFEPDDASTGYMRSATYSSQPKWRADYNAVLMFGPKAAADPALRIADRKCEDATALAGKYYTVVQSIRMIGCKGETTWGESTRRWSAAVIGVDSKARLLLIHVRSPYSMKSLTDVLKKLPIDLVDLQYAEGGPEATLYVHAGDVNRDWVGSYETGFNEDDDNKDAWGLPNVIAVIPRP
jgi:hypothetical protein